MEPFLTSFGISVNFCFSGLVGTYKYLILIENCFARSQEYSTSVHVRYGATKFRLYTKFSTYDSSRERRRGRTGSHREGVGEGEI